MKHLSKDFSCCKSFFFAIGFFLCIAITQGNAQSIQRQSIGICGANMVSEGFLVKQTIGQPYATNTYYQNGIGFRPGFQQPSGLKAQSSLIARDLVQSKLNLKVYPNPATNSVSIQSLDLIDNGMLRVLDSSGRLILKEEISALKNHSIDCGKWPKGLYLITVSDEQNASYSSKLLITK